MLFRFALTAALFAPALVLAAGPQAVTQLVENARYWEDNGRGDLARAALEKHLLVEPDNPRIYYQLGMTGIRMGEPQRCADIVRRMQKRIPKHDLTQALNLECRIATQHRLDMAKLKLLTDRDQYDKAFAILQQLFPDGPPQGRLGVEYLRLQRLAGAGNKPSLEPYQRYSEQYPEDIDYQLSYAELLASSPRTAAQALPLLKTLINQPNVNQSSALEIWRTALRAIPSTRLSQRMLQSYLQHDKSNSEFRAALDRSYRQRARARAASALQQESPPSDAVLRQLQSAIRRLPADAWLRYDLARLLIQQGQTDAAVAQVKSGLRAAPRDAEMQEVAARLYLSLNMPEEALAQLNKLPKSAFSSDLKHRLLSLRAASLVQSGEYQAANRAYDELLRHPDASSGNYQDYVDALDAQGNTSKSMAILRQAVSAFPNDIWMRFTLAQRYLDQDLPELAINLMHSGIAAAQDKVEALYALALVQDAAEQADTALASLQSIASVQLEDKHRDMMQRLLFERCLDVANDAVTAGFCAKYAGDDWERRRRIAARQNNFGATEVAWQEFSRWAQQRPKTIDGLVTQLQLAADLQRHTAVSDLLPRIESQFEALPDMVSRAQLWIELRRLEIDYRLGAKQTPNGRPSLTALVDELKSRSDSSERDAATLRTLAQGELALKRQHKAIAWLQLLVRHAEARPEDQLLLIDTLLANSEKGSAAKNLEALWAHSSTSLSTRLDALRRWYAIDPETAKTRLQALSKESESLGPIYWLEGELAEASGQYAKADQAYTNALRHLTSSDDKQRVKEAQKRLITRRTAWAGVGLDSVRKPGDSGVSRLDLTQLTVELHWAPHWVDNAFIKLEPTRVTAGTLNAQSAAEYAQFATVASAQRQPLLPPTAQLENGVALGAGYSNAHWSLDLGLTPVGFERQQWVGGIAYTDNWGSHDIRARLQQRAQTSTLLSFAGATDPVSGTFWGAPLAQVLSFDIAKYEARYDYFFSIDWQQLSGKNIADNSAILSRVGGDIKLLNQSVAEFFVGLSASYWSYDNNQRFYSFGHGGYYSPQSYLSIALPLDLRGLITPRWSYQIRASVAYSRSNEDDADYYPGRPDLQQAAIQLGEDPIYRGGKGSGNSVNWRISSEYQWLTDWVVGVSYAQDRSAFYEPDFLQLYVRSSLGRSRSPLYVPPKPISPYH
ncbi:MAG: cellulose synthase subunit BcsC-related outer membrane protein [Oceanococcus sp.]